MNEIEIAAYLDRRLGPAEKDRVESHLAGCEECRDEVVATTQILTRTRRPRRLLLGAGLAAAAAAALLVVTRQEPESPLRDGPSSPVLLAYGPLGDVPPGVSTFVWGSAPGATTYRVTISGADGVPLWSAATADTLIQLPDSVALHAGSSYYWIVDGLLANGTTRTTGLREFRPGR